MEILGTTSWCTPFHSSNFGPILMNYLIWFYRSAEHLLGTRKIWNSYNILVGKL